MIFSINAWIDRNNPFISILNLETEQEVARFDGEDLKVHIEKGNICISDFCEPDTHKQQLLVMDLLLLRCFDVVQHVKRKQLASNKSAKFLSKQKNLKKFTHAENYRPKQNIRTYQSHRLSPC